MSEGMRLFDSHCHLAWEEQQFPAAASIARAQQAGVDQMMCVAVDLASARRGLELARAHPGVRASLGIHPNDLPVDPARLEDALSELAAAAAAESWSAIGETGIDLHWQRVPLDLQRRAFVFHLELARRRGRPVIIHCRKAAAQVLELLRAGGGAVSGVMHCYSESPEALAGFLELGLHVSFAGNLTYPKAGEIRAAALLVPEQRLLIETDAPFLAPQPVRGQRNEPAHARHTFERLAELRGAARAELAASTRRNAEALFGPGPAPAVR